MGVVFTDHRGEKRIKSGSAHAWDPTLHLCACHEQALIQVDMHSGLVILVRPVDHSTESVGLFMEIYHQCANEELVLAAAEGALPPVLLELDATEDGEGEARPTHPSEQGGMMMINPDGTEFVQHAAASVTSSADGVLPAKGVSSAVAGFRQVVGSPDYRPPPIKVNWIGRIHLSGTYARNCHITEYMPGIGLPNDGHTGPVLKMPPREGGLSDCAVIVRLDESDEQRHSMRHRKQEDLSHRAAVKMIYDGTNNFDDLMVRSEKCLREVISALPLCWGLFPPT